MERKSLSACKGITDLWRNGYVTTPRYCVLVVRSWRIRAENQMIRLGMWLRGGRR